MTVQNNSTAVALITIALLPSLAYADGGGPLLLIINFYLFTIGQIWILLAEFFYLSRKLRTMARSQIFKLVLIVNTLSSFAGALLLPLLWAALFGLLADMGPWKESTAGGVLTALGTWVIGDNSPFPWLTILSTGCLFIITYFVTVWIEFRLLVHWREKYKLPQDKELRGFSFIMNGISYVGLIVLFLFGILLG